VRLVTGEKERSGRVIGGRVIGGRVIVKKVKKVVVGIIGIDNL